MNNHFWNCYEDESGDIVVETVTATEDYLDNYFGKNLAKGADWDNIFYQSKRCHISFAQTSVACSPLLAEDIIFDYPTFNPHVKMSSSYKYFYAIAVSTRKRHPGLIKLSRSTLKGVRRSQSGLLKAFL